MAEIHASAIVDPRARIGNATIGAYSVIGPDVTVEDGAEIGHHVVIDGPVVLGAGVQIGHGSVVGAPPQDLKYRKETFSGVRIGPRTVLREHVTINRATTPDAWTSIGSDCFIMTAAHVAHDCRLGDGVIVINTAGIAGHCDIADRATIGAYAGLHPFTRVGEYAYIGGLSKITSDVPPYMIVDGNPATARGINVIGLRRAGIVPAERRALQDAYRLLYRSGIAPATAVARMRTELEGSAAVGRLADFIAASKRGISGPPRRADAEAAVNESGGVS
ncbi:MAG: acyl-ACP--UDP-N-acetylglucosamine O-acyltransferase [Candidatus Rokubacteria bacterium]|nr:acyl-ACP--UDP-N-acetylglucosamine O-acyltransferase [Candidatus Rokubacteria bacterium]